jgi:hypothetical protein
MHVIRLRGNWSLRSSVFRDSADNDLPAANAAAIVSEPSLWLSQLGPDFRGHARLARRFHAPTGITPTDVVALTFEHCGVAGSVALDGVVLADFDSIGADQPVVFSHDIRERLQHGHELTIDIASPQTTDAESPKEAPHKSAMEPLLGTVRLEIRPA